MGVAILILGLAIFFAVHLAPIARPDIRAQWVGRLGEIGWKVAYSIASVVGFVLIVQGYRLAGQSPAFLWFSPGWTTHANNTLMIAALGVYLAGPFKGTVARFIRHPQLTGVKIWALAHLLANGALHQILLFGGFLAWAVASVVLINKRDGARVRPGPAARNRDLAHAGVTVAAFLIVALVHNWLGVYPFPG
jgi:uncharacterized membrane protein